MNYRKLLGAASTALMIVIVTLMLVPGSWAASKYKTLYKFRGRLDGVGPVSGLIFDSADALYGTADVGGSQSCEGSGCGTVFKLTPNSDGTWTESTIHRFHGTDGAYPYSDGLIFDATGTLYGTTLEGGSGRCRVWPCAGTAFTLAQNLDGSWTEKVLYNFCQAPDCADGSGPWGKLIFDQAGNLYGTTYYGGTRFAGTVFKLAPNSDGSWKESVIYSFGGTPDGEAPRAGLIFDQTGNLYGTTEGGGDSQQGVVFKLTANPDETWTEKVIHTFAGGSDGCSPDAGMTFDQMGSLYGTAGCGDQEGGIVFKLTPNPDGSWTESVLHSFKYKGRDGSGPGGGVILDAAGNLYGTTQRGGNLSLCDGFGCGVVYKLTIGSDGKWKERVLHSFRGNPGAGPGSSLILDTHGNIYGTTDGGGVSFGSVFEITP